MLGCKLDAHLVHERTGAVLADYSLLEPFRIPRAVVDDLDTQTDFRHLVVMQRHHRVEVYSYFGHRELTSTAGSAGTRNAAMRTTPRDS